MDGRGVVETLVGPAGYEEGGGQWQQPGRTQLEDRDEDKQRRSGIELYSGWGSCRTCSSGNQTGEEARKEGQGRGCLSVQ